jgi:HEAT repeat protein
MKHVSLRRVGLRALIEALGDPALAPRAARALGHAGDPRAVAPLMAALGRRPELRREITVALGRIGAPALPIVLASPQLEHLERGELVQIARRAGRAGFDDVVAFLLHPARRTVLHAIWVLRAIGDPRAIDLLLSLQRHRATRIHEAAFRAAGHLGRLHPAELRAALARHGWTGLRLRTTARDRSVLGDLLEALRSPDPDLRRTGATCLGAFRERSTLPALFPLLADPDREVREEAAKAVGRFEDPSAVAPLLAQLQSRELRTLPAAYALGRLSRASIRPLLEAARAETDPWSLWYLSIPIEFARAIDDVDAMLEALAHPSSHLRMTAARAYRVVTATDREERLLPPILALLRGDPDPRVRDAAAIALRSAPRAIAEPALTQAYCSDPGESRAQISHELTLVRRRVR